MMVPIKDAFEVEPSQTGHRATHPEHVDRPADARLAL